jgi:metal-sulfur cluster biosynthetic enzyme
VITVEDVHRALRQVADPCAIATGVPIDIVAMGLVSDVRVEADGVVVTLRLTSPFCMQIGLLSEQAQAVVSRLPGADHVRVEVDHTAEWMPDDMEPAAQAALRRVRPLRVTKS